MKLTADAGCSRCRQHLVGFETARGGAQWRESSLGNVQNLQSLIKAFLNWHNVYMIYMLHVYIYIYIYDYMYK